MANFGEKEVFRITPELGKYYTWAESTRRSGVWPNEKRFAPTDNVIYVGELINISKGGLGDGSWRTDTFLHKETKTIVHYSYGGDTCFIEVPCKEKHKVDQISIISQAPENIETNPQQSAVLGFYGLKSIIKDFLT
jgi:hypothetical protein